MEKATDRGLIILDDDVFGASTEPQSAASCLGAFVEEIKKSGSFLLVATHHLQLLELLKAAHPDISFLQVETTTADNGIMASKFRLKEGIAASSHGLEEAVKMSWPALSRAVEYFNSLSHANGSETISLPLIKNGQKNSPPKYRGYFYSKVEQHVLNIYGFVNFISTESIIKLLDKEIWPDDMYQGDIMYKEPKGKLINYASDFAGDSMMRPETINRKSWEQSIELLSADSKEMNRLEKFLYDNLREPKREYNYIAKKDKRGQIYFPTECLENFIDMVKYCVRSPIPVLHENGVAMEDFIKSERGKRFISGLLYGGFEDAMEDLFTYGGDMDGEKFKKAFSAIAALVMFSHLKSQDGWSMACHVEGRGVIEIQKGAHTDLLSNEVITRNDINIKSEKSEGALTIYTGFNTGGKSTLAKTIAQIVTLKRLGWPVPADYAEISDFSDIQVLSPDVVAARTDPFFGGKKKRDMGHLEEMLHLSALMIQHATPGSLMILDEPFSGCTEPTVSAALTAALAEELTKKGATVILITHLLDVVPIIAERIPQAKCFKAKITEENGKLKPLYSFTEGIAASSHGLQVAKQSDWPGYEAAKKYFDKMNMIQIARNDTRASASGEVVGMKKIGPSMMLPYGIGIDGKKYDGAPVDVSCKAISDKKIEELRAEIAARVAGRNNDNMSTGPDAVAEAKWLFAELNRFMTCSDAFYGKVASRHMLDVANIIPRLTEKPSAELIIAGLLHDADRFFDGYYVMSKDSLPRGSARFLKFYKPVQHPRMVADVVVPLLEALRFDGHLTAKIGLLIRNHEKSIEPDTIEQDKQFDTNEKANLVRDSQLLREADSVSNFERITLIEKVRSMSREDLYEEMWFKYSRTNDRMRSIIDKMIEGFWDELQKTSEGIVVCEVFSEVKRRFAGETENSGANSGPNRHSASGYDRQAEDGNLEAALKKYIVPFVRHVESERFVREAMRDIQINNIRPFFTEYHGRGLDEVIHLIDSGKLKLDEKFYDLVRVRLEHDTVEGIQFILDVLYMWAEAFSEMLVKELPLITNTYFNPEEDFISIIIRGSAEEDFELVFTYNAEERAI
ncbi:MAG: hypothetical protein Q8Q92_04135, partial [bacterium]|nr:hypothetical protein [bacterium]